MFFSIIVPTYNPKNYLSVLLTSVTRSDCSDDIEIILSDDCSDEAFDDVIASFPTLNIRVIKNDKHYGFPRIGRQNGAEAATGKWICFADQDDYYLDHAFDIIRQHIEEHDIQNYLVTDIIMYSEGNQNYTLYDGTKGWTHGKFYEKSFWDEHRLGYSDVQYNEDISLSTKIGCVMTSEEIGINVLSQPVYVWNRNNASLSSNPLFLPLSMPDYVHATMDTIIEYIEKCQDNRDIMEQLSMKYLQTLWHVYFYCNNENVLSDRKCVLQTALAVLSSYERFRNATGLTTADIIEKSATTFKDMYTETRQDDYNQVRFIEQMSFREWMYAYLG